MSAADPLAAFDFALPPERIAQQPAERRDAARLLVLDRASGAREHAHVRDLPRWLRPGDLLVRNVTQVWRARLRGRKATGGAAEALLLAAPDSSGRVPALVRCRGRLRTGLKLRFARGSHELDAEIAALDDAGAATLAFPTGADPFALGEMPLPPYVRRAAPEVEDETRYQTVYAQVPGSVAAPTAGLHLDEALLARLQEIGVEIADVVLHVGAGTFRRVRPEQLAAGRLHPEAYQLSEATRDAIARARARGGRVAAVGTTTTRVLEHAAAPGGQVRAGSGTTELLLQPGARFQVVDALLTNFHLPRSSLLLLVAAFAGREHVLAAYAEAIERGYRFYSYGDAMWIA